jgi:hypothetical protein
MFMDGGSRNHARAVIKYQEPFWIIFPNLASQYKKCAEISRESKAS